MFNENQADIVIVGGGIIGLFTAYYLAKYGARVIMVDQPREQLSCSHGNAGLVVPSSYVPLAAPGMISKGLRWMLSSKSPFAIRPKLNRSFYYWLWKFLQSSSKEHVARSLPLLYQMNQRSSELFESFYSEEKLACDYQKQGHLVLCQSEKRFKEELKTAAMGKSLGVEASEWSKDQLADEEPDIEIDTLRAVFYPGDSHMDPHKLMEKLNLLLSDMGVVRVEGKVCSVHKRNKKVQTILQNGEEFYSNDVVITAGIWSDKLCRKLGIKLPLLPGKGYSLTMDKPSQQARRPMFFAEAKVVATPMGDSLRFGGTLELGERGLHINRARVKGIIESIPKYLPTFDMSQFKGITPWCGLRPCSPDGLPYIGQFPSFKNVYIATGHAMLGLSMAPVTGKIITDMIAGQQPEIDLTALAVDRF